MGWSEWYSTYYPSTVDQSVHIEDWQWQFRDDKPYRQCSYCGGVHPEDLAGMPIDEQAAWAMAKRGHKYYATTPYGQIKLYTQHLADNEISLEARLYVEKLCGLRFEFANGEFRVFPIEDT
jgi:hypothetical protein